MKSSLGDGRARLDLRVLDALRGLAAGYVVLGHTAGSGGLLWAATQSSATQDSGFGAAVARLIREQLRLLDYGPVAVMLFFVISGFCIHYRQAQLLASGDPSRRPKQLNVWSFAKRRLRRLYPPLLFALALTAALDAIGAHVNGGFYLGAKPDSLSWLPIDPLTWTTLLGNMTFQSGLSAPTFGTDTALWSLGYEFWFYLLYPVLFAVSARRGSLSILPVVGGAWVLGFVGSHLPSGLWDGRLWWVNDLLMSWGVWALGAVIADAYAGRLRLHGLRFAALLALASLPVLARFAPYAVGGHGQGKDMLWGGALAILVAFMFLEPPAALVAPVHSIAHRLSRLGDISYSLYLVHVPWLALLSAWWLRDHSELPHGAELAIFGALTAFGLGYAAWYFVERHFVSSRSTRVKTTVPRLHVQELAASSISGRP